MMLFQLWYTRRTSNYSETGDEDIDDDAANSHSHTEDWDGTVVESLCESAANPSKTFDPEEVNRAASESYYFSDKGGDSRGGIEYSSLESY